MTNSTDDKTPPAPAAKVPKVKGPIRTEAVVPITIIFVLAFLYFRFMFDANLRQAIEWTGTYVQGAEVDVGKVTTSFLSGTFELDNLQVTDKEAPVRNILQLGAIKFGFSWDALLRAKFVVNEAAINQIEIYSPRKSPGFVKPPEPPPKKAPGDEGPSMLSEVEGNALSQIKKDASGNALGDLASLLEGASGGDVLKNLQGELKSDAQIKALQAELKEKQKVWKDRIEKLPKKDELKALSDRAKLLKFNTKDPKQFAADVKEAGKISKEADGIIKELKETSSGLKNDADKFNTEFKSLDDLVKQDMKDLESRLKIPDLNLQDLSMSIFANMFGQKLGSIQKYMVIARKYMPAAKGKDPEEKKAVQIVPAKRNAGKTYQFPVTTGYPLFWLKHAAISSEPTNQGFSGKLAGTLTDVTTDPKAIGKPAILDVKGDFPRSDIHGMQLRIVADHIGEPKETLDLTVGSFPFLNQELVNSPSLGLGVKKAVGTTQLSVTLQHQELNVKLNNEFKQVDYDLTAKSQPVKEAVASVLAGIPVITMSGEATGSWGHLNIHLNSNLGQELSNGLKKYVQVKIDAMKQQVHAFVDGRIKGEREKLNGEFAQAKGEMDSSLKSKQDDMNKASDDLKKQSKSQQGNSKDKLKDAGKKLLKGLKF